MRERARERENERERDVERGNVRVCMDEKEKDVVFGGDELRVSSDNRGLN